MPRGLAAHPAVVGALLCLTVLVGYLLSYNVDKPTHNADWYIRYQVTCSIVERNGFFINPYDASERSGRGADGRVYAQYTLGQTTAMVPLYLLGRALAGVAHTNCDQRTANTVVFLTCKLLGPILGALLAALFYATARLLRYPRRVALALTLLLAFGSSLWPDVLSNEEHTMESLFLLAAAYAALRYTQSGVGSRESGVGREASPAGTAGFQPAEASLTGTAGFQPANDRSRDARTHRHARGRRQAGWKPALPVETGRLWLVAMGLAAGFVFVTRVAGLIAIPIFALYLAALHLRGVGSGTTTDSEASPRERIYPLRFLSRLPTPDSRLLLRDLALYGAGVLPGVLVNVAYNLIRWGNPLQTGPKPDHTLGYPPWFGLPNLLVSPGKGLLWYTPALLLLFLAARPFWRRHTLPALLFAIVCGVYLLFYANVNYWHGDPAWGPRYLYATLPYLILPLGEVFGRWRGYRRPARMAMVGVLALSFLVQFSATTVSYWRHWHYIYGYHYDQVEDHGWGSNLNYWWKPEQSPILISLQGIADITQKYVAGAPLLEHSASQRLSDPRESSVYQAYGQAGIVLTDLDKLRYMSNWNTFTPWWAHVYSWWPLQTVVRLALALVALFLAGLGLLLVILTRVERPQRPSPAPPRALDAGHAGRAASGALGTGGAPLGRNGSNGNGGNGGNGHGPLAAGAILSEVLVAGGDGPGLPFVASVAGERGVRRGLAIAARPALRVAIGPREPVAGAVTGLPQVGLAALAAALLYGGIADVAALRAPRAAPPLVRTVPASTTVRDGNWGYQVLGVTSVPSLPGGLEAPIDAAHHYTIVRLRLDNGLSRPQHGRPDWFDLTDSAGLRYQYMGNLGATVAELYHVAPAGGVIPARSSVETVLVFQVRNATPDRDLALLGPGIALVRLSP